MCQFDVATRKGAPRLPKATAATAPSCPSPTATHSPVLAFHTRTVLSFAPENAQQSHGSQLQQMQESNGDTGQMESVMSSPNDQILEVSLSLREILEIL